MFSDILALEKSIIGRSGFRGDRRCSGDGREWQALGESFRKIMIDIFKLSDSIRNLQIEAFHMPIHIYNKLRGGEIKTLEQMVGMLRASRNLLNNAQKEKVRAIVTDFHLSLGADGVPDWKAFCESQGITLIPQNSSTATDAEILANFTGTVKEILTSGEADEKKWPTIQYRFGLNGKSVMTLDEIGQAFGKITREAVRLVESKSLLELRRVLLEENFAGKTYRVDDRLSDLVREIRELVSGAGPDYSPESELFQMIETAYSIQVADREKSLLRLLFTLFGMSQIRELPETLPNVWKTNRTYSEVKLRKALTLISTIFTGDYVPPIDEFELLARINRKMSRDQVLSMQELNRMLGFCDFVETNDEGMLQTKFEHIGSRVGQAERLLMEAGKPLEIGALVREMNRRLQLAGRRKVETLNIANVMSSDSRFIAIGSSGLRGLAKWDNVESRSIVGVMEDALVSMNRPATAKEVFDYVNTRRPASLSSIKVYLDNQDRFLRTASKEWGLASWEESRRLNAEFEKTRRRHAPRQRRSETQFERSIKTVREHLENALENEAPLSILVSELVTKLALRDKSAYQYIGRMGFVEKTKRGASETICKLVEK